MDSADWSNGIRYHTFDTKPDSESKLGVGLTVTGHVISSKSRVYFLRDRDQVGLSVSRSARF